MLEFQFQTLQDFALMSGHGPYVWACYATAAVVVSYLLLSPVHQKKQVIKQVRQQQLRR